MIKRLHIENLVLIKKAEIHFSSGFSIITGETGSGKTVFLKAMRYVTGERADADAVREGAQKAIIEAEFEPSSAEPIHQLLEEAGIEWEKGSSLLLKREISKEGRSKAFINCQMVTLSLLEKVGSSLITFTDQHAHYQLKSPDDQRHFLDLFGNHTLLVTEAKKAYEQWRSSEKQLHALKEEIAKQTHQLQKISEEIEEIESAKIQESEEQIITEEHNRLSSSQELGQKTSHILKLFEASPIKKISSLLQQLASIDPFLNETTSLCREAILSLDEVHVSLTSYLGKIEEDPKRLEWLEQRLALIDRLKRRFGDPLAHLEELRKKSLHHLSIDEKIENLQKQSDLAKTQALDLSTKRYKARLDSAKIFSLEVTKCLQELNMPFATFSTEVRSGEYEDHILFNLQANPGQPAGPIQDHASGGELSRLMIALQTTLADKNPTPTIVFDEIDANIGGETATVIGKMFQKLGAQRQVLAITHFPQVAKLALHHFRIGKEATETSTVAFIDTLEKISREKELLRMGGGI